MLANYVPCITLSIRQTAILDNPGFNNLCTLTCMELPVYGECIHLMGITSLCLTDKLK